MILCNVKVSTRVRHIPYFKTRLMKISGSCTMKECWKRVSPFKGIAEDLKKKYYNATSVGFTNTVGKGRRVIKHPFKKTSLYFTAESPDFCKKTTGRQCLSKEHCATLCCGRGHHRQIRNVSTPCNYKFLNCCLNVTYDICHEKKEFLICKWRFEREFSTHRVIINDSNPRD